ncbi:MAG: MEDS domain-containing protein [SAR324 cluster bacterium]|nr:MEDS domain-containing protein [SAR324 cluster bacterium]
MKNSSNLVDLGFAQTNLPAGTHICQIYSDDDERNDSLLSYLVSGLKAGECSACFSENITEETLEEHFSKNDLSFSDLKEAGTFSLSKTEDVYFQEGKFDPEVMLNLLSQYYKNSVAKGYAGARVIGEMSPEIENIEGGSRLCEYESRVSILLREHPVTAVCQYHAEEFDGATIMEVLKVHPMMIVRGSVVHNPFYIPPEEYLGQG